MKSPPTMEDCDDIFGPPRTYPTGYAPPKTRPSMISAKYRQKEERRKVLKISINKLKKIEDPEASLCRSVLINNTMKRLQREARDEKIQKQQLNYPRCYDNDNFLNLKGEFIKNENKNFEPHHHLSHHHHHHNHQHHHHHQFEKDFHAKLAEEIDTVMMEENEASARKRSFDEMDDCDVQDVLSQFYMPPTPRMLTCIDDDEDVNVVNEGDAPAKRAKLLDEHHVVNFSATSATDRCDNSKDFCVNNFINNNIPSSASANVEPARLTRFQNGGSDSSSSFSCGHASMFSELQSNVYHNLIASLET